MKKKDEKKGYELLQVRLTFKSSTIQTRRHLSVAKVLETKPKEDYLLFLLLS